MGRDPAGVVNMMSRLLCETEPLLPAHYGPTRAHEDNALAMGAAAGMCGIAVQELTEFSLQIPGVALLFATCLALALHEPAPVQSRRRSHRKPESAVVPT